MTKLLRWDEKMAVGDPLLDAQHMRLITVFNELSQEIQLGCDRATKLRTLVRLADYSLMHFAAEEKLMEAAGYPGLAEHRGLHLEFKRTVLKLVDRYKANDPLVAAELARFLHDWIFTHILTVDVQYAACIAEYRARAAAEEES